MSIFIFALSKLVDGLTEWIQCHMHLMNRVDDSLFTFYLTHAMRWVGWKKTAYATQSICMQSMGVNQCHYQLTYNSEKWPSNSTYRWYRQHTHTHIQWLKMRCSREKKKWKLISLALVFTTYTKKTITLFYANRCIISFLTTTGISCYAFARFPLVQVGSSMKLYRKEIEKSQPFKIQSVHDIRFRYYFWLTR